MNALDRAALSVSQTWRQVEGWPYQISDGGHVWSEHTEKILSPYLNETQSYLVVDLRDDGDRKQRYVHRLILEAFRPDGNGKEMEANHIDGDPLNNQLGNLEWVEPEKHDEITNEQTGEFAPVEEGAPF